jgi:hypothetical protein
MGDTDDDKIMVGSYSQKTRVCAKSAEKQIYRENKPYVLRSTNEFLKPLRTTAAPFVNRAKETTVTKI